MGMLFSLFCFSHEEKEPVNEGVSANDFAIFKLKTQRDTLLIERRNLLKQVEKDLKTAQSFLAQKDKNLALIALRKKKHHSQLVEECSRYILKLEELISSVEFALVQQTVVEALEVGNAALRKIQKELSVDYVSELVNDAIESKAHFEEINALLSEAGIPADDADVMEQFQKLEASEAQTLVETSSEIPQTPIVTTPDSTSLQAVLEVHQTDSEKVQTSPKEVQAAPVALLAA